MALIIYFENITQLRVLKCASISLNSLLKRFITDRKPIYGYVLLISNLIDWVLEILNDSNKGNDYDFTHNLLFEHFDKFQAYIFSVCDNVES